MGGNKELADEVTALQIPPDGSYSAIADPFDGQPIKVKVVVGSRESMSGRVLRRWQFRYLVVIAVLPDGKRVSKLVDIPNSRVTREIAVHLP